MPSKEIYYSDKYTDDKYEYRHVMLPKVRSRHFFSPEMKFSELNLRVVFKEEFWSLVIKNGNVTPTVFLS
jgi:hypothetical protein